MELPRFGRRFDYTTCLSCEAFSYSAGLTYVFAQRIRSRWEWL